MSPEQNSFAVSLRVLLSRRCALFWPQVRRCCLAPGEAVQPRQGGKPSIKYGLAERTRILQQAQRKPDPETDGTATWSLKTLCQTLRRSPDGLPEVSEDTIRTVLLEAGFSWQRSRSWRQTGQVVRKRKRGPITVCDPDAEAKKKLIEEAYTLGEKQSLVVWAQDEAGPTRPSPTGQQLATCRAPRAPTARTHPQRDGQNADLVSSQQW